MSVIVNENNKIYDADELMKLIHQTTGFDVLKDISSRTKREDVFAFILQCDVDPLKQDLEELGLSINIEENEDEYISELMNKADEYAVEIEENLPEDLIGYYYAYEYDEDEEIIKTILVVAFDRLGQKKLKEVGNRLITVIGD
ncbi:hypothetical protein [Marinisporobacter balticus]|uniref:Uncharacterized protein n=1 Tax=Marinisporobacter balticus TaxID=2018667 RepID=A0A4V2SB15_9FIRM|nr:hypothetical protein [Marinisporobacter balticus]TCO73780.1 hypothetical protein EV214_11412 [Marinisporobacter balticus]